MATKSTAFRNIAVAAKAAQLDRLEIRTAGGAEVLARFNIGWGSATNGSVSLDLPQGMNVTNGLASGVAAEARLYKNADPTIEITGLTVTMVGGGGQVTMDNTNVAVGQEVRLSSLTLTESAETA